MYLKKKEKKSYIIWTIKAKNNIIHDRFGDVIQVEPQISSTLMRNSLLLHFLEVAEVRSQSMKKYEHLDLALQKIQVELLAMHDVDDLVNFDKTTLNSQVLSNLPGALQDPPYVLSKGRPKSLRQKNPKENQPTKKRKCSICKETGHVRRTCPSKSSVQVQDVFDFIINIFFQLDFIINIYSFLLFVKHP